MMQPVRQSMTQRQPWRHRLLLGLLIISLLAASCTGADDSEANEDEAGASSSTTAEATTTTTAQSTTIAEVDEIDSDELPARRQLDWIVTALNSDVAVTVAEVEQHFSPAFLSEFPATEIVSFFPQIYAVAEPPYTVERFEASGDGQAAEAILLGIDDRRLSAQIFVAADAPNLIEGFQITPADVAFPTPINIEAIDERLADLGANSSLGVYNVTDGNCAAVHEVRTDETVTLGSVFKLWVLATLAHEIDAGRASWDETMPVTDELRSTPVAEIYELETGTEVTLERLAGTMISVSDNTATDMLIDRLGRQTVEADLERIGVTSAAANIPLLSTGNLFALKFVADPPNAGDYRDLDEAGKRAVLAELDDATLPWVDADTTLAELATSTNADGIPADQPRDLDIEWFATTDDLCQTLVYLDGLSETPGLEPVAAILEMNPGEGIPFDRDRWPTIRFKGGSEPGVVAGAWWFEGPDGDRYVVAGGVADPDEALQDFDAVLTLASAIELID